MYKDKKNEYFDLNNPDNGTNYMPLIAELIKDETKGVIVKDILNDSKGIIKIELLELVKNSSFIDLKYYEQSKNLFRNDVPIKWGQLIIKIINQSNDIESYIKEICNAFNNKIKFMDIENLIDVGATPNDISKYIEKNIKQEDSYKEKWRTLNSEFKTLKEKFKKQQDEIEYYKKKYTDNNRLTLEYKYQNKKLKEQLETISKTQKQAVDNTQLLLSIKSLVDTDISNLIENKIDNINRLVANSFVKVTEAVSSIKQDDTKHEIEELKNLCLKMVEKLDNVPYKSSENYVSDVSINEDDYDEEVQTLINNQISDLKNNEELNNDINNEDEFNDNDRIDLTPEEPPILTSVEDFNVDIPENELELTNEEEINRNKANICDASEYLKNEVLTSNKFDSKEEEKINFFAKLKFNVSSYKKQIEIIMNMMIRNKFNINTIKRVKEVLNDKSVQPKAIFNLINEGTSEEDFKKMFSYLNLEEV